jgi:hypothetical protein
MADILSEQQQATCQNAVARTPQAVENVGAGEGNRTLVISLEEPRRPSAINEFSDKIAPFAPLSSKANFLLSE